MEGVVIGGESENALYFGLEKMKLEREKVLLQRWKLCVVREKNVF